MTYRPDIDGLRAIAVISVILYHAGSGLFPGGFVGVDIFFVISGFLITRIITEGVTSGNFSFLHFYRRRILRIFPALITVIVVTLIAGYFLLLPGDYSGLGESSLWALMFSANFYFLFNTGYFDQAAETMPLLHTWSLGVEEQFYIVWPLLILLIYKAGRGRGAANPRILAALISASLIGCFYCSYTARNFAFYSPVTRAWELLAGAALFPVSALVSASGPMRRLLIRALPWTGAALLGLSVFYLSDKYVFPGFVVVVPVLGAVMLILAGSLGGNVVSAALSTRVPVFFGKISYSLYLWHWPIFTYYRHYTGEWKLSALEALCLIAVTCAVSAISWKKIEQPLRRLKISNGRVFALGGASTVAAAACSLIILASSGFQERLPERVRTMVDHDGVRKWECVERMAGLSQINPAFDETRKKKLCIIGFPWRESPTRVLLWGDSHAGHYVQLLDHVAKLNNFSIAYYFSCPPYLDNEKIVRRSYSDPTYSERCGAERREILEFLEATEGFDLVILASFWSHHYRRVHAPGKPPEQESGLELMRLGMSETLARINPAKIPVLILSDVPGPGRDLTSCVVEREADLLFRKCDYDLAGRELPELEFHRQSNRVLSEFAGAGVRFLNVSDRLCGAGKCDNYVNGEYIYRDASHLRVNLAAETVGAMVGRLGLVEEVLSAMREARAGEPSSVSSRRF